LRADALAADSDYDERQPDAIVQLANNTPPGPVR